MPTPRNGDSAQAAIALLEGVLQVSKPRPVKTEPPTEAVAGALLAWASPGRARTVPAAARESAGESPVIRCPSRPITIARRLPRIGPAGHLCSAEGPPR